MPHQDDPQTALAALQALTSEAQLAALLGTSPQRLRYHLFIRRSPYRQFEIPKKTGGQRIILAPPLPILLWQKKLSQLLTDAYVRKKGAYGFCIGGGVVQGAKRHLRSSVVLNLDLKDFFDAIHFGRVRGVFEAKPFEIPRPIATILAQICCWKKALPQGAPTSPILSNYVCRSLDTSLARLAQKHHCQYTRYADDISFSTRRHQLPSGILAARVGGDAELGKELACILEAARFEVNQKKVWVRTARERQTVTGLVVNTKLNVRKDYRRNIRSALHVWEKSGFYAAEQWFAEHGGAEWDGISDVPPLLEHLRGKISFLAHVRGKDDPLMTEFAIRLVKLCIGDGLPWKPVVLYGRSALTPALLSHAVWVVTAHHNTEDLSLWTGSAFTMEGGGIVTNQHVTEDWTGVFGGEPNSELGRKRSFLGAIRERVSRLLKLKDRAERAKPVEQEVRLRVRRAANLSIEYDVTGVVCASHRNYDLARLDCDAERYAVLRAAVDEPLSGEEVLLAGFPNWKHAGESCRVERGSVSHLRRISGVSWIEISPRIRPGNSGGPVLGSAGTVIGIASKDESGTPVPNAAVSVTHLKQIP
jgi:RNA-directed DNA polymerase